jgi:hypothetical protein
MFRDNNDGVVCHIHPAEGDGYEAYGLLICDLIRHTAKCFNVPEGTVFDWVRREYRNPTTTITRAS